MLQHPTELILELNGCHLRKERPQTRIWSFWLSFSLGVDVSPAALATVVLRDAVLVFAPNVNGGENERHQHGEAAHQGKDHDALLLRLQETERH